MDFKADEIEKVVMGLIGGSVKPIGDSSYDDGVRERMSVLIDLTERLYMRISDVGRESGDSPYKSVQDVVSMCKEFLDNY